jgi:hypothetical protein
VDVRHRGEDRVRVERRALGREFQPCAARSAAPESELRYAEDPAETFRFSTLSVRLLLCLSTMPKGELT